MRLGRWAAVAASLTLWSACTPEAPPDPIADPVVPPPSRPAPREREIRGGRAHDAVLAGLTGAAARDPAQLVRAVQADLRGRLGAVAATDFVEIHRSTSRAHPDAQLEYITLRQTVGGVPIDETYLYLVLRRDPRGVKLVSSSYRLYEHVALDPRPVLPRDRAVTLAQDSQRLRTAIAPAADRLAVHKLGGRLQLAWSFGFRGSHRRSYVIAAGPETGRAYTIDERVFKTTGTVTGTVVRNGAPGGAGVVETVALPNAIVSGTSAQTTSGADGGYAITVPNGSPLTAVLSGRATVVTDAAGQPVTASGTAIDGGVTDLGLASATELGLAQITTYYGVDQVRTFLEQNGVPSEAFGTPLASFTNLNDVCNAFYSPFERSINFFRSGGGCNNSAIDTVVAHEYGHFVDDLSGGITNGGLSEGWGDLLGCFWTQQPLLGFDLFPGVPLRNCQNDYVYPPGGGDEAHNLGQAWAGFGWDARQNLIAAIGPAGDDLARALILPSFQSNAPDIPAAVREAFLRDDDDGDLSNHTPHWDALFAAALHHGLTFAVEQDFTPPAPVTDLVITNTLPTRVDLRWTATGDDGTTGTATQYQLRWATFPIDAGNFPSANLVPTPPPGPAGSIETLAVTVPPEVTVYVALIVSDEQLNESALSNVATVTTPAGTPVYSEGAEGDTSGWTATGLWHVTTRRAAEGTHAFWYGQEATGNYDTGGTNAGDLTSPVIDLTNVGNAILVLDQFIQTEPDPWDLSQIIVTEVDNPAHTVLFQKSTSASAAFGARVIPLEGFDHTRIQLRFHFDTIDSVANSFEGFYVDHLRIFGSDSCDHTPCVTGGPLDPTCSPCAETVCAVDSYCCTTAWDQICVNEARSLCGGTCSTCGNGTCDPGESTATCPGDCPPPACTHDTCDPGAPLEPACDSCATTVCAADPFCCTVFWDRVCVQETETLCGRVCEGCAHDQCSVGDPLEASCDSCTTSVCNADPYCCTTAWDSRCVQEAADTCGLSCTVCSHSLCTQGTPLETSCDPCVGAVCAADPYCCNNTWDARCIASAQTTCGLACERFR